MISIIITYYTGVNILYSNLSLLLQTKLENVEIIIVNDNPKHELTVNMLPPIRYCAYTYFNNATKRWIRCCM